MTTALNARSYTKTTFACVALVVLALLSAVLSLSWLPPMLRLVGATLSAFAMLGAATVALAGGVVLARHKRCRQGASDLFLALNRSREPDAIAAKGARAGRTRRWLARRVLGHDLCVGDTVEVKTWAEIQATLDHQGCLEQMPFMPEMLAMCGRRMRVFRCMHRLFDYRRTRRMRHMDGAVLLVGAVCNGTYHGGCEAQCHTIWKAAWLRRVDRDDLAMHIPAETQPLGATPDFAALPTRVDANRYACQLTQLHAASREIERRSAVDFLRPLVSGNVAPTAFAVGWLTDLFNDLQQWRGGDGFPAIEAGGPPIPDAAAVATELRVGDCVVVRSPAEIGASLNDQLMLRGLWFEPDMLKHCGTRCCVQAEVRQLIDIVTGEMRVMKTPAYILRGVHFSGERQLFNAQYEPLFWRAAWLQRDES